MHVSTNDGRPFGELYHGTSSQNLKTIQREGFAPMAPFSRTLDRAVARSLQDGDDDVLRYRIATYRAETGIDLRHERSTETSLEVFKSLYPEGQHPVVAVVALPSDLISMAVDGDDVRFDFHIPATYITFVVEVGW